MSGPDADVALVVAAAGTGSRYSRDRSKLFEPLWGLPLFLHCLRRFAEIVPPESTVLVVAGEARERFVSALRDERGAEAIRVVVGGASRGESVLRGLEAVPGTAAYVAVHDAARPLATADLLRRCIDSARACGSGVAARRVTDTIKVTDEHGRAVSTLDRSRLWATETPQVFRTEDLRQAYRKALQAGQTPTDEAAAVESLGLPVRLVESLCPNPKVTHSRDLALVQALAGLLG